MKWMRNNALYLMGIILLLASVFVAFLSKEPNSPTMTIFEVAFLLMGFIFFMCAILDSRLNNLDKRTKRLEDKVGANMDNMILHCARCGQVAPELFDGLCGLCVKSNVSICTRCKRSMIVVGELKDGVCGNCADDLVDGEPSTPGEAQDLLRTIEDTKDKEREHGIS
jgi:hypothetical protein